MDYQRLLIDFQKAYLTQPIMLVAQLTAVITGLLFAPNKKITKYFLFYISFDLLILLVNWVLQLSYATRKETGMFVNITNVLIGLVELYVYNYFFKHVLNHNWIKVWIKYSFQFYSLITALHCILIFSSITINNSYIAYLVGALEFILLIPPCLLYYYELLNSTPDSILTKRPSFWIVTGIFFLSLISIPYYLLTTYITTIKHEFRNLFEAAFFYTPLIINFIFLTKAFSCKKSLTI